MKTAIAPYDTPCACQRCPPIAGTATLMPEPANGPMNEVIITARKRRQAVLGSKTASPAPLAPSLSVARLLSSRKKITPFQYIYIVHHRGVIFYSLLQIKRITASDYLHYLHYLQHLHEHHLHDMRLCLICSGKPESPQPWPGHPLHRQDSCRRPEPYQGGRRRHRLPAWQLP